MTKIPFLLFLLLALGFAIMAGNRDHKEIAAELTDRVQTNLANNPRFAQLPVTFAYAKGTLDASGINMTKTERRTLKKLARKGLPGGKVDIIWTAPEKGKAKPKPGNSKPTESGKAKGTIQVKAGQVKAGQVKAGQVKAGQGKAAPGGESKKDDPALALLKQNPEAGTVTKAASDPKTEVKPAGSEKADTPDAPAAGNPAEDPAEDPEALAKQEAEAKQAAAEAAAMKAKEAEQEAAAAQKALAEALADAHVTFPPNRSDITGDHSVQVKKLADLITSYGKPVTLDVKGFAQDDCDRCVANALSHKRAQAVIDALIKAGVPKDALQLEPPPKPVEESNRVEKAAERRVELHLAPNPGE